jgi:Right handed beta helix region
MKLIKSALIVLCLAQLTCSAEIIDNFLKNDWKLSRGTPGKLDLRKYSLYLADKVDQQPWVTAYKTFDIDINKTPLMVVKVMNITDRGQVKLIRQKPFEKKPALVMSKPGIYTYDLSKRTKWKGKNKIQVMLYALGEGAKIRYSYIKFTDKLSKKDLEEIKKYQKPPKDRKPFELVPLFNSCAYYFITPKKEAVNALYRKKGGEWQKVLTPVWINEEQMYRGSIVGLDENTDYEFRILDGKKILGTKSFKTWSPKVPIAKTIVLNSKNFKGYLKIYAKGSPDGWIKYTSAPGFVLKNNGERPLITLIRAKYIIFEGLTLQGGSSSAVVVSDCDSVRFINCDISGWGRIGVQRFDKDGKYYTKKGRAINNDAGIYLKTSKNTVVERCYFHDPRNTANSWRYSHPAGPEGMMIAFPESTVVRYNDIIGSDEHRWNDGIEGSGNFYKNGGFNRDADIYGNMITMANDDCVEIDGGQQNVRVFLNKFENALCSVSIQGCMAGPSYVYRNLIANMGDEFGKAGQLIKSSSHYAGKDAVSFIFNNTVLGDGKSLPLHRLFKIVAKNNIFSGTTGIGGRRSCKLAETDYNLVTAEKKSYEKHGIFGKYPKFKDEKAGLFTPVESCSTVGKGVAIDNFTSGEKIDIGAFQQGEKLILPYRPIPVSLNKYQLNFSPENSKAQTVTATIGGKNFSSEYKIRKNNVFKWFTVTPASGKLISGKKINFTVKLKPELMKERSIYKGVFLIRLKNGYSRPVSIYAKTDVEQLVKPSNKGIFTLYLEAEKPISSESCQVLEDSKASSAKYIKLEDKKKAPVEYSFDIPKDGIYFILMRVKSKRPARGHYSMKFGIDNKTLKNAHLKNNESWCWDVAADRNSDLNRVHGYKLKKGKHTIKIIARKTFYLDMIAVTKNPKVFEPR